MASEIFYPIKDFKGIVYQIYKILHTSHMDYFNDLMLESSSLHSLYVKECISPEIGIKHSHSIGFGIKKGLSQNPMGLQKDAWVNEIHRAQALGRIRMLAF